MNNWCPIETAPRDGTPILALSDDYEFPFVVFWSANCIEFGPMPALPEGSTIARHWILANAEENTMLYEPTKWQPLPQPGEQ